MRWMLPERERGGACAPHDHDRASECGLTVGRLLVEPDAERVHRLEQPAALQVGSGGEGWRG